MARKLVEKLPDLSIKYHEMFKRDRPTLTGTINASLISITLAFLLVAVQAVSVIPQTNQTRVMPADFKSDNCTMFPDGNYCECCVEHDKDYYFGGTEKERRASDRRLYRCVKEKKNGFVAGLMYLGVRIGGVPFLPTPFRWGFGKNKQAKPPIPSR
jgi:hypothetical protein